MRIEARYGKKRKRQINSMIITNSSRADTHIKKPKTPWFYIIIIFLNSGIIFLSNSKRTGIPFLKELYWAMLFMITVWLIFRHKHWFFYFSINTRLLIYVLLIFILPSFFALFHFGQPLIYGLLEERRTLSFLVFFPIFYGLCVGDISPDELIKYIKISSILCIFLACLYAFGVITPNQQISFSKVDLTALHLDDIRYAIRFPIGADYVLLSLYFILLKLAKTKISFFDTFFIVASLVYMYMIVQSRQIWLEIFLVFVFLALTNIKMMLKITIPIILSIFVVILLLSLGSEMLQTQLEKITILFDSAVGPLEQNARYLTSETVFHELVNNYFLGMGSLSEQWHHGFQSIYGRRFYITDVGMIGVFYRLGILAIGVIAIYYYILLSGLNGLHSFEVKALGWIYLISGSVYFFSYSYIIWGGKFLGILFAMLYYEKHFLIENKKEQDYA